ncbi:MAG: hypothetical protein C0412_10440 [Flavobacterium sp.]|nr:hypothetical protein [Flavobacterium sp.]
MGYHTSTSRYIDSIEIDGDTKFKKSVHSTKKMFIYLGLGSDPKELYYRLNVFNSLDENYKFKSTKGALERVPTTSFNLCDSDPPHNKSANLQNKYYGRDELSIQPGKFVPLPSLSPNDQLESLFIQDRSKREKIEVYYSKAQNLYYLKNTSDLLIETQASFIINTQKSINIVSKSGFLSYISTPIFSSYNFITDTVKKYNPFGKKTDKKESDTKIIEALVKYCSDFSVSDKNIENLKGKELLEEIYNRRVGACRHRSKAFFWKAEELKKNGKLSKNFETRIIRNDLHEYIEIRYGSDYPWEAVDLGGYPAEEIIEDLKLDELKEIKEETKDNVTLSQRLQKQLLELKKSEIDTKDLSKPIPITDVENFFGSIVNIRTDSNVPSNVLLNLPQRDIDSAYLYMHRYAQKVKKQIYYIDSPEDLVCNTATLSLAEKVDKKSNLFSSKIIPKGGGSLDNFLKGSGKDKILIINWNNFPRDKFVSCHTVVDKDRNIQGVKLPPDMLVVSMYPTDAGTCYSGSDFIERHNINIPNNYSSEELKLETKKIESSLVRPDSTSVKKSNPREIEVYGSEQWQERLIGSWQFTDTGMKFKPGQLLQDIEQSKIDKKPIVLKNAPWHVRDFALFWQKLMIENKLSYYGKTTELEEVKIYQDSGYNWDLCKESVISEVLPTPSTLTKETPKETLKEIPRETYVLNPFTFSSFITNYEINNKSGGLLQKEGIFTTNKGKELNLLVTANIGLGQWYELLQKATDDKIKLHISLASNITLPKELEFLSEHIQKAKVEDYKKIGNNCSIYLTKKEEMDGVVTSIFTEQFKQPKIVTISDYDQSDIFYRTTSKVKIEKNEFLFTEEECDILSALRQGETVILRGHVTPIFAHYLASLLTQGYLLHNGKKEEFTGKLIVVSDSSNTLSFCQDISQTPKIVVTAKQPTILPIEVEPPSSKLPLSLDNSVKLTEEWYEERTTLLKSALGKKPWVSIEGPTGCGKSTFINHKLTPRGCAVFNGIEGINDWIKPCENNEEFSVLFIDESNLTGKNWAMFRDLDNEPPTILLDRKYIQLSNKHRVIFASNPSSYSAGRIEPELIKDYAYKIAFQPIPLVVLYEEILKKLKPKTTSDTQWQNIAANWLKIYQQINTDKPEPVVTPRQLETMSLLLNASIKPEDDETSISQKATSIAYRIFGPYVGYDINLLGKGKIKEDIMFSSPDKTEIEKMAINSFTYTDSRLAAYNACSDFLTIRESGCKIDGLGGVLLEGEPGIGKSVFILAMLKAKGYTEYKDEDLISKSKDNKKFVYLPSDASYEEKKRILGIAYKQGYIVVMDELNTPLAENLLNDLVGTKKSESTTNSNGFIVFGTQNPAYMVGREVTSAAVKNRFLNIVLPSYTQDELYQIESKKHPKLSEKDLKTILSEFIEMQKESRSIAKDPVSYRLLQDYLKIYEVAIKKIETLSTSTPSPSKSLLETLTLKKYKNQPWQLNQLKEDIKPDFK